MTIMAILKRGLAAAVLLTLAHAVAYADTTAAEQAAEMLARVQSVDMKCGYLQATDKDTLSSLVARAELALATRESIEATKATLQRGHTAGLAASCNASEKQAVISVLAVARKASSVRPSKLTSAVAQKAEEPSAVPVERDAPVEKPLAMANVAVQEPGMPLAHKSKSAEAAKPAMIAEAQVTKKAKRPFATTDDLTQYAQMTEAYYLALRCNGGGSQVSSLYASIMATHDNLMQSHGAREVSSVLHGARARAGSHGCL